MGRFTLNSSAFGAMAAVGPIAAARRRYPQFRPYPHDAAYERWIETVEPGTVVDPVGAVGNRFGAVPMVTVVVPVFNALPRHLDDLMRSLTAQTFSDFEAVFADASTDPAVTAHLASLCVDDPRLTHVSLEENGGISRNTNAGIERATGEFIAFVDHDDTLAPHALNEVAAYLFAHPDTDIVYTDEDKITDDGRYRHSPHRKPGWSPHQYLSCNYTSHLCVIRRELLDRHGGPDPQFDGAQDYELILRLTSSASRPVVGHIPKVLYHWRTAAGSTAAEFEVKSYVRAAGRLAVQRALAARGVDGEVVALDDRPGWFEPRISPAPGVSVLLLCVGPEAPDPDALLTLTDTSAFGTVSSRRADEVDLPSLVDALRAEDIVVAVRENVVPHGSDWLQLLAGVTALDVVAAVAPRIVDGEDRIVDMGRVRDASEIPDPLFVGHPVDQGDERGHPSWVRDVDELSGAVVVARRDRFGRDPGPDDRLVVWSPVTMTVAGPRARPRVSVCVPLYHHADTVERCLRSILDQDHDDFEIVVVDDASSDDGAAVARTLLRPGDRVIVNPMRLGAAENHNRCVEVARGELVQFVHGDDELLPGALTTLAAAFDDDDVALAFSRRRLLTDDDEFREFAGTVHHNFSALQTTNDADALIADVIWKGLWRNFFGEPSNVMFRRHRALDAGGFRDDLAQTFDIDLWVHLIAGGRVVFVDEELSVRHHDGDTLSAANRRADRDWLDHTRMLWGVAMDGRIPARARVYAGLWLTTCHPTSVIDALRSPAGTRLGRLADVAVLPLTEIERRRRVAGSAARTPQEVG
ncbi:glycosyltransferase [Williamsia deligens]|uniref:Glycosyltransferase n=1 Tax=Williamsia deligens TaxID=321325 RepID=A0ABW3G3N2_9NOCA|nr:glycosyltransferase [Williamsia deligens]MCP2193970.1 Glycosyl transferase family 2 [Williamsia deligens]